MKKNFVKTDAFRVANGVPTPANVDYDRIYRFNSKDVDFSEIFEKYLANRGGREDELEKHVQSIKNSILQRGNTDKIPPITVDINTLKIADGNCRFNAVLDIINQGLLPNVTIRVMFEDIPENEFDERVIELNMGQKSWTLLNFIYNYSERGFESFTRLIDFCNRNESLHSADGKKINPRYAAAALLKPASELKNPTFTLTEEEVIRGGDVVYEANQIRSKFSSDPKANGGGWYEQFLKAWSEFRSSESGLGDIPFKEYLKWVNYLIKHKKREVQVPLGSNKKSEWNQFFRTVKTYVA